MPRTAPTRRTTPLRRRGIVVSIESRILILRHQKVILDTALAELYGVPVKRLNEQVKRNRERFPLDFMFQLTKNECKSLRSQFATSNKSRGGRRFLPYAFTEHGATMAATVLNSKSAVEMSVFVVRAFVRLRDFLAANRQLAARIEELEDRLQTHDSTIQEIIDTIKKLMTPPSPPRRRIGFELPRGRTGTQSIHKTASALRFGTSSQTDPGPIRLCNSFVITHNCDNDHWQGPRPMP